MLAVAVPSLPTTIPAVRLAREVALRKSCPAANAVASEAITVSPAPVTSNTSLAWVPRWKGSAPRCSRVIPCAPRVTSNASIVSFSSSAVPFSTSVSSSAHAPTTASNSLRLGVSKVALRYFSKSVPLGSIKTGVLCCLHSVISDWISPNEPLP